MKKSFIALSIIATNAISMPVMAACIPSGSSSYTCSGTGDGSTQHITGSNLNILIENGYTNTTSSGNAFNILETGSGLTIEQQLNSTITGFSAGMTVLNQGVGATNITTSGTIKNNDMYGYGVMVNNSGTTTDLTFTQISGNVVSSGYGLAFVNQGSGNTTITTSGNVTGSGYDGIRAQNTINGKDIIINQLDGTVSGGVAGIAMENHGSGNTAITVSGSIVAGGIMSSSESYGVYAYNDSSAKDITITQEVGSLINATDNTNPSGYGIAGYGIYAKNLGTGSTTIKTSGNITAPVYAYNGSTAVDIDVTQLSGYIQGIRIDNYGTGSTSIMTDKDSTVASIYVYNSLTAKDITMVLAGNTDGASMIQAINVQNEGSGSTTITLSGDVKKGTTLIPVSATNGTTAKNIDIVQTNGTISDGNVGIATSNNGIGTTTITTSGNVFGNIVGIVANNGSHVTDLTVTQLSGSISGSDMVILPMVGITQMGYGIYTTNSGVGATTITTSGDVSGGYAIYAVNDSTATDLSIKQIAGTITGGTSAIKAQNSGSGVTIVNISSIVTGGTETGIYTTGTAGLSSYITLNNGADVSATSGIAIEDTVTNATVTLNSGSKITGSILLGDGSDILTINSGATISGLTLVDGGDDYSAADGMIDTLTINQSLTGSSTSTGVAGDVAITNWENINVDAGAALSLTGDLETRELNIGSSGTIGLSSTATTATIRGNVTNAGIIDLSRNSSVGETLTIAGNYVGSNGHLFLNTVLDGDTSSLTDKLVITGDAAGTTYVRVTNLGGSGAQTVEGVEIINVQGTSTADAFVKEDRIVAGSYDYSLVKGNTSGTDSNSWYLTSKYIDNSGGSDESVLRPEAGSYLSNLAAANTLFNLRLHDRLGETQYTDLLTGEQKVTSMWLRYQYGYNKFDAGQGQLKNDTHWNIVQLGGDVAQWTSNDTNRFHLGLMWGYGRSSSDTDAKYSGYSSTGEVDGYSVGMYGTWYSNDADKTGLYVDSWLLWNDFDASVHGDGLDKENYDINGFTASVESGYTFKLGQSESYSYWLQPKGQVTWMNVDADDHTESNGTKVTGNTNNWETRLGLRATMSSGELLNSRTHQAGQFFVEANWIYNSKPFEVEMDGAKVEQQGARNIGEIKGGVEGNIYKNTNVWFNLAYQRGEHDYSNAAMMLGAKYSF